MATLGLERFSEEDSSVGIAAVPKTATSATIAGIQQLLNVDMLESLDFLFNFTGTANAFGTEVISPWFPYIFINQLSVPYQSSALKVGELDGHQWWLVDALRGGNKPYNPSILLGDQQFILTTGYTPEANNVSSSTYTVTASVQNTYQFNLNVPIALYFDKFYDTMQNGQPGVVGDVYVSPLPMASTGRNVVPRLRLNPVENSTLDQGPFVNTVGTALTWTDDGSTLTIRRNGWRQPSSPASMPPIFPWAYNWTTQRVNLDSSRVAQVLDVRGQVLSIICRFFDPTLASGIGGPIPVSDVANFGKLTYGSGINKFYDTPNSMQRRIQNQHGWLPTEGVWIWDLYADTRSNCDALNTYNTSGVQVAFDFGANTPGAGSYMDLQVEWLTAVK